MAMQGPGLCVWAGGDLASLGIPKYHIVHQLEVNEAGMGVVKKSLQPARKPRVHAWL